MYIDGMLKSVVLAAIATALTGLLFLWACLVAYRGPTFPPQSEGMYVALLLLWINFLGWTNDTLAWLQREKGLRLLPHEFYETTWGGGIDGGPVEYIPVCKKVWVVYPLKVLLLTGFLLATLLKA